MEKEQKIGATYFIGQFIGLRGRIIHSTLKIILSFQLNNVYVYHNAFKALRENSD